MLLKRCLRRIRVGVLDCHISLVSPRDTLQNDLPAGKKTHSVVSASAYPSDSPARLDEGEPATTRSPSPDLDLVLVLVPRVPDSAGMDTLARLVRLAHLGFASADGACFPGVSASQDPQSGLAERSAPSEAT